MNNSINIYPLKFDPIVKQKVWGGDKLKEFFGKSTLSNIGESWEISGVEGSISIIRNGPLKNRSLQWALENFNQALVGDRVYQQFGNKFPLLFKFIDAREDLSVQVHPNDALALKRHKSFGKTEMWYIMDAERAARIILGFKDTVDQQVYTKALETKSITEILNFVPVNKGDAFILNPGTIHAIGGGILLAEIQQTSDITYRIYDWDRPDTDGKFRQLHTNLAMEAIDFSPSRAKMEYKDQKNAPVPIGATAYFEVNKIVLTESYLRDLGTIHSFVVYMCLDGTSQIEVNGYLESINKGETLLIPAVFSEVKFHTTSATFLEVYIP